MATKKTNSSNNIAARTIDLAKSFDSDDSIQIIVEGEPIKAEPKKNNNPFDAFLNRRKVQRTPQERLEDFRMTINGRAKTKSNHQSKRFLDQTIPSKQKLKNRTVIIDDSLAPSLHTRAKGSVKMLNQFVIRDLDSEEREFKPGKYEFAHKNKTKDLQSTQTLKQTKLSVVNLDDSKYSQTINNAPAFKLDGPMYPWRKKTKPQPQQKSFRGIQFTTIKNNGFLEYERQKQQRKKQRQEEKKKRKQNEEKQKLERFKHIENTFSSLLGLNKTNQQTTPKNDFLNDNQKQSDEELKNLDILEEIQNEEQLLQGDFYRIEDYKYNQQKRLKYGLDQVVRPYDSFHAFPFVKAILGYQFKSVLEQSAKPKRIPDIFTDSEVYKKTFHYLVINECIADLHQRMKKIEKETSQKIQVQIGGITDAGNGMIELKIREVDIEQKPEEDKKQLLLKNYSISKNRIGVITNSLRFRLQNYGIHSSSNHKTDLSFTFLCMLKTPESKQQLKDPDVLVSACVHTRQLQYIMSLTTSRKAYFFDLQKLSTNIREYMSVSNVEYSWLSDSIYNPTFIDSQKRELVDKNTRGCIDHVFNALEKNYNKIQFQSMREIVLRERGIVLLQGPPGTGKTSTLLGLLAAQYAYLKKIGDRRKIMICAPSNAAIDHITKRIRTEGLVNGQGVTIQPNVLRIGIVQTEDKDIRGCSLDHICQSKIGLEDLFHAFRRQKIISKKQYQELQKALLKDAEILVVTLSSSGGQKMEHVRGDIACLIVDEAAQATEPSLLIALQSGVEKVMLIGDPCQLPATTLSPDSNKTLFNRSLFERFIDSGIQPYFLNIQYRMMPMIREFPSRKFYHSRLLDGQSVIARNVPEELQGFAGDRSLIFIDIKSGQQKIHESSFCNYKEVNFITKMLKRYKLLNNGISVGVITPYQAQRKLLLKQLGNLEKQLQISKQKAKKPIQSKSSQKLQITSQQAAQKLQQNPSKIMINTIDSFQGQEKDLILISTVRSNDRKQIGFLMDERRINVSITRAKYAMIIIGNGDTLGSNEVWDDFLKFIEGNKLYFEVNSYEDEEKVLSHLNRKDFFNQHAIRRRFYQPSDLTFDPRKIRGSQIGGDDFKKKQRKKQSKPQHEEVEKQEKIHIQNSSSNFETPEEMYLDQLPFNEEEKGRKHTNSDYPLKKSHIPLAEDHQFQAEELIRKKRKKEEETKDFQKACQRLKMVEKEKANDDFYKFLFQ